MSKQERSIGQAEYASIIDDLHGVSTERGCDVEYTENMYISPSSRDGALESFPGARELCSFGRYIHKIHLHRGIGGEHYAVINSSGELYRVPLFDLQYFEKPEEPFGSTNSPDTVSTQLGTTLYLTDGSCIYEVKDNAEFVMHDEESYDIHYVPTTFVDGVRVEHRNLLSPYFHEKRLIELADDYAYGTPDLIYAITDKEKKECAVTGIGDDHEETVYIPRFKTIGGVRYTVTDIGTSAFYNVTDIKRIVTNRGLKRIGVAAFMGMTSLESVALSDTVEELCDYCFLDCTALSHIHIGASLRKFGKAVFASSVGFVVDYEGSEEMLESIENYGVLAGSDINYYMQNSEISLMIPVSTEADDVTKLLIGETQYFPDYFDPKCGIRLTLDSRAEIAGKMVTVTGVHKAEGGVLSYSTCSDFEPARLIYDCRFCHSFDGRIFFTGNPYFPELVFYSSAIPSGDIVPLYISDVSYFTVGYHAQSVTAMTTAGQSLAIFTSSGGDSGNTFLIKPRGEGRSRDYTVVASYGHSEISAAINHLGETFCYSPLGVMRFRGSTGRCTDFEVISSPISSLLAGRFQYEITMTAFDRYLVISHGADMFLCDLGKRLDYGRSEAYDWYPLKDVGSYEDDSPLYVFADEPYGEYVVHEAFAGQPARGTVYTVQLNEDEHICYVKSGKTKYRVYETNFRDLGVFNPPTAVLGVDSLLFFGTERGSFCVFNTDMRGTPPPFVEADPDFDFADYDEAYGDIIHPYYYTMSGHPRSYKVVTKEEDCGKPYLGKRTVRNSLTLNMRTSPGSLVSCAAIYDGDRRVELGQISASCLDFDEVDFGGLNMVSKQNAFTVIKGAEQTWRTMQLVLYSKESYYPFALRCASYRYTLSDKTKNNII